MKKRYAVYFDYTGAGRGPEVIDGPFNTEKEAQEYLIEWYDEKDKNYFVDVYRQ